MSLIFRKLFHYFENKKNLKIKQLKKDLTELRKKEETRKKRARLSQKKYREKKLKEIQQLPDKI